VSELFLGQPLFPGENGVDQLVEIIKVLGTPDRKDIQKMNPNYTEFKFPQISKVRRYLDYARLCTFVDKPWQPVCPNFVR
jgi:hypothetical protein